MNTKSAYSLVELIVTMSIAAILVAFAIPSLRSYSANTLAGSVAQDLASAFNFAHNQALALGTGESQTNYSGAIVSVCTSSSMNTCSNSSADNSWSNGWIVFISYGVANPNTSIPDKNILQVIQNTRKVPITASLPQVNFNAFGVLAPDSVGATFIVTPTGCTGNNGRQISFTNSGSATISNVTCGS